MFRSMVRIIHYGVSRSRKRSCALLSKLFYVRKKHVLTFFWHWEWIVTKDWRSTTDYQKIIQQLKSIMVIRHLRMVLPVLLVYSSQSIESNHFSSVQKRHKSTHRHSDFLRIINPISSKVVNNKNSCQRQLLSVQLRRLQQKSMPRRRKWQKRNRNGRKKMV